MLFEFDDAKSELNKNKHGIDFVDAQRLWNDENILTMTVPFPNEMRYLNIGKISEKHWTIVTTIRANKIRIISARRSRKKEIELYES